MFVALTAIVTYPQIVGLAGSVPFHSDPYFTMWRLGWVAHAIVHSPSTLFDANIFHPERHTLAYSDAMLLPGLALAPLFWAGVHPVLIYNTALLGAFVLSALSMFALALRLTGDRYAAFVAGTIYAFSPYRFGHYMHLELQLVFWIPLALVAVHELLSHARIRTGVTFGLCVGCQLLSCVYEAIFLVAYGAVLVPLLMLASRTRAVARIASAFVLAGVVAALLAIPYVPAYLGAQRSVGTRSLETVRIYSATWSNYVAAPRMNRVYGGTAITDAIRLDEMNLFPGITPVLLMLAGVVFGAGRVRWAYVGGLIFACAMTAGANTPIYVWLYEHIPVFQGLRSPARFDIFVVLSMAVLAAFGVTWLRGLLPSNRAGAQAALVIVAVLAVEFASRPSILPAPEPTRVDAFLARRSPVVIIEMPLLSRRSTWGSLDWQYMYQGIGHFQPMLNGYSGYAPASYYEMREYMASFPDDRSIEYLHDRHVDYLIVRAGVYDDPNEGRKVVEALSLRSDVSLEVMWPSGPDGMEAIFRVYK
jgi:hypothetical protein